MSLCWQRIPNYVRAFEFPPACICAIEPAQGHLALFGKNIASLSNIVALAGATRDRPARLMVRNPEAGASAFRIAATEGSDRAFTVSEITGGDHSNLLIVKIDIDGGEAALLRSNTEWCGVATPLIVELHDWLCPAERKTHNFLRVVAEPDGDFVIRGENVFLFSLPSLD